jgi:HSP20 family protein
VDVFETPDGGLVRVEVAGMDENDFDVVLEDRALVIAGNRREPTSLSRRQCHRKEIASGYFRCEVEIAWPVDADRVEARYQDGFLTIALPRRGWTDDV